MKDKSVKVEQARLAAERLREDAAAWRRVQKSIKASKPVASGFKRT